MACVLCPQYMYLKAADSHTLAQAIQLKLLSTSCVLLLSITVTLSLLRNSKNGDPKACRLEISGHGLIFVSVYLRTVRTQTGTKLTLLGPATEKKPDRSEFILRPVTCKREKRNVRRPTRTHADLSSSRSHANTSLLKIVVKKN